jgi:hypothetical protein
MLGSCAAEGWHLALEGRPASALAAGELGAARLLDLRGACHASMAQPVLTAAVPLEVRCRLCPKALPATRAQALCVGMLSLTLHSIVSGCAYRLSSRPSALPWVAVFEIVGVQDTSVYTLTVQPGSYSHS